MEKIVILTGAAHFDAIGTSGQVYPAAAFVSQAQAAGALTLEMNLKTPGHFKSA